LINRSDHVTPWSSLALIVGVLYAVHTITLNIAKRRQLLGLRAVAVWMSRCRILIIVGHGALDRTLQGMNLRTKLVILHANALGFVARHVEVGL
jgi:hypothetical protein